MPMANDELIVYRLDEMQESMTDLRKEVKEMREEIIALKATARTWGVVAGVVAAFITQVIASMFSHK